MTSEDLISQGRRNLLCGEIPQAVENFQKACELLSSEHGDLHESLAEPNLLYGTALLELARMEGTVIGYALDGVPEDSQSEPENDLVETEPEMTAEEKEDLSNQIIDAMCEPVPTDDPVEQKCSQEDTIAKTTEQACENAINQSAEDGEEDEEDEGQEEESDENDATGSAEPAIKEDVEQDDDDVTNLQLAWEVIEVAKKLFSQNTDDKNKLKVAECLEKLAEISREKEDYTQALADLQECLDIRSAILPNDHRDIAETHYQIGSTQAVAGVLDLASSAYKKAVECLQSHADNLKQKISVLEKSGEKAEELCTSSASLKEVESLIPDVQRRLSEIEEDLLASKFTAGPSTASLSVSEDSSSIKPADDITHLVRKKRTENENKKDVSNHTVPENGTSTSPQMSKKIKLDSTDKDIIVKCASEHRNGLPKPEHINGSQI